MKETEKSKKTEKIVRLFKADDRVKFMFKNRLRTGKVIHNQKSYHSRISVRFDDGLGDDQVYHIFVSNITLIEKEKEEADDNGS